MSCVEHFCNPDDMFQRLFMMWKTLLCTFTHPKNIRTTCQQGNGFRKQNTYCDPFNMEYQI